MLNRMVDVCVSRGVRKVYVGDLTGIRQNKDFGKLNVLLHNFWIRSYTVKRLKDKLTEAGIGLEPISEYNTSSVCFMCESKVKRPHQHYVVCEKCGRLNADLNGAVNILKKGKKEKVLLKTVSLYQFKWVKGGANSWMPVETGEGDKPPCNLSKEVAKSLSFQRGVV